MKVVAAAVLSVLSLALESGASPLLRAAPDGTETEERRRLSSNHVTISSPLNCDSCWGQVLYPIGYNDPSTTADNVCYEFRTVPGGPTTAQLLVMFRDEFVENKGRVYFARNIYDVYNFLQPGLYEVLDKADGCVSFELLYGDSGMGQIVAASGRFDPIEIIGVSGTTIYGYYPSPSGGPWSRKATAWGDAMDGTLASEPVEAGDWSDIAGLTPNGRLFHLWGDFDNFNYASHSNPRIYCDTSGHFSHENRPASIGDWSGSRAGRRGIYCARSGSKQLTKYTWHGSGQGGPTVDELIWTPAARIGRLSPSSNIYGVSTEGKLLLLWDEKGVAVHSVELDDIPELTHIRAVGGVDNGYGRGVFAVNQSDEVFNVYYDGGWKVKQMPLGNSDEEGVWDNIFFGNFDGKTYILHYGYVWNRCKYPFNSYFAIYRMDYVGGSDRHDAVRVASGNLYNRRLKEGRNLCG